MARKQKICLEGGNLKEKTIQANNIWFMHGGGNQLGAWLGYPLPQGVRLSIKILCGWKGCNQSHEMFQTCGIRLSIKILCG